MGNICVIHGISSIVRNPGLVHLMIYREENDSIPQFFFGG